MWHKVLFIFANRKVVIGIIGCAWGVCALIFVPKLLRILKGTKKTAVRDEETQDAEEQKEQEQTYVGGPMAAIPASNNSSLAGKNERGYLTNVFRVRHGRTELVELRLKEALGSGMDREPAVPFKGSYFAIEKIDKDGNITYIHYDPREEPVLSNYTPQDCYDAVHWDEEVDGVYSNNTDWQEKVGLVIIGLAIFLNFIVALVALGKLK